jgi:hypothetical protein
LPHRRGPHQFALLDSFVRRAAKPKTLSIIIHNLLSGFRIGTLPTPHRATSLSLASDLALAVTAARAINSKIAVAAAKCADAAPQAARSIGMLATKA